MPLTTALQLISNGKTFVRVDKELSWPEALRFCQLHLTDLADLQSMNTVMSIKDLYSITSSTSAWIGLFFDMATQQLAWSSGSIFTSPVWSQVPQFEAGICATLYSKVGIPALGAETCTEQKPFICYYGTCGEKPALPPNSLQLPWAVG